MDSRPPLKQLEAIGRMACSQRCDGMIHTNFSSNSKNISDWFSNTGIYLELHEKPFNASVSRHPKGRIESDTKNTARRASHHLQAKFLNTSSSNPQLLIPTDTHTLFITITRWQDRNVHYQVLQIQGVWSSMACHRRTLWLG